MQINPQVRARACEGFKAKLTQQKKKTHTRATETCVRVLSSHLFWVPNEANCARITRKADTSRTMNNYTAACSNVARLSQRCRNTAEHGTYTQINEGAVRDFQQNLSVSLSLFPTRFASLPLDPTASSSRIASLFPPLQKKKKHQSPSPECR